MHEHILKNADIVFKKKSVQALKGKKAVTTCNKDNILKL